jgi:hypothetical protein
MSILGAVQQKFLDPHPFSSPRVTSRHFRISPPTVKEILRRDLGLKKFNRRWIPHLLSNEQKTLRVDASRKLLSLLGMYAEYYFEGTVTRDGSWFQYSSYSDSMFAGSRESVVPKIRRDISGRKIVLTIFFTSKRLLVLEALQKGTKSIRIISLTRYFEGYIMKRGEFHAKRASRLFQFPGIIRCVIMVTRSPRNLP